MHCEMWVLQADGEGPVGTPWGSSSVCGAREQRFELLCLAVDAVIQDVHSSLSFRFSGSRLFQEAFLLG